MHPLIRLVMVRAGVTEEQAREAVRAVNDYLQAGTPVIMTGQPVLPCSERDEEDPLESLHGRGYLG